MLAPSLHEVVEGTVHVPQLEKRPPKKSLPVLSFQTDTFYRKRERSATGRRPGRLGRVGSSHRQNVEPILGHSAVNLPPAAFARTSVVDTPSSAPVVGRLFARSAPDVLFGDIEQLPDVGDRSQPSWATVASPRRMDGVSCVLVPRPRRWPVPVELELGDPQVSIVRARGTRVGEDPTRAVRREHLTA